MSRAAPRRYRPVARRDLLWLLLALLLLWFTPAPLSNAMEHRFVYFPEAALIATPADAGLVYEEVFFPAADGTRLHGWYLPGEPDAPLILFCHGNAGNISHRVENLALLRTLGAAIFIFDYRGYGRSAGRADEEGTYADARGALAWLQREKAARPARMLYFGRSLGAAVALQLALEHPPAALVLETPFTSLRDLGRHHYPGLHWLLGWLVNARYDNLAKIAGLRSPLLVFQGERDTIVPPAMARRLFDQAPEPKIWHLIRGADHNDTLLFGGEAYLQAWQRQLAAVRVRPGD